MIYFLGFFICYSVVVTLLLAQAILLLEKIQPNQHTGCCCKSDKPQEPEVE